jgi:hypothetical protein
MKTVKILVIIIDIIIIIIIILIHFLYQSFKQIYRTRRVDN